MSITWRPAIWQDIEPSLSIQTKSRGEALVGAKAAINCWKELIRDPFFASAVLESSPPIRGCSRIGFGASVLVSPAFMDAEMANLRPDINSRVIASIHHGQSVLATRDEVARANAGGGIDLLVLYGNWHDEIVNPAERQEVQTLLATSFTEWHAGYRIRRIVCETADEPTADFAQRSLVYRAIAEFPDLGRVVYLMTTESAAAVPASLGNILFRFHDPVLRLRESDQQLLAMALSGATDLELTTGLGMSLSAVKARWRSTFARISEVMPSLVCDPEDREGRGMQKRHRVLSYIRSHPEELRPYAWRPCAWKVKTRLAAD